MDTEKLINEILNNSWSNFNHKKLMLQLGSFFRKKGFSIAYICPIKNNGYKGHIDLAVYHIATKYRIGIEIDCATPRWRSIDKLKCFHPDLALFILKSNYILRDKIWQKVCKFPFKFAVLNLPLRCVVFPNPI